MGRGRARLLCGGGISNQRAVIDERGRTVTELRRDDLIILYAHAIPDACGAGMPAGPGTTLEVGAGAGYWARLLRDLGGDIVAYDLCPPAEKHWLGARRRGLPAEVALKGRGGRPHADSPPP